MSTIALLKNYFIAIKKHNKMTGVGMKFYFNYIKNEGKIILPNKVP